MLCELNDFGNVLQLQILKHSLEAFVDQADLVDNSQTDQPHPLRELQANGLKDQRSCNDRRFVLKQRGVKQVRFAQLDCKELNVVQVLRRLRLQVTQHLRLH